MPLAPDAHSPAAAPPPFGGGTPPRVALFTGNYHHIADGVSLTLNRLVRFLEAQGAPVLVFGPTVDEPAFEHAGTLVPVPSVPAPGRPEYRISLRLPRATQKRLDMFGPDLVHIATPDVLGLRALRWARKRGVPVVSSYHTHFPSYLGYYNLGTAEPIVWRYLRWFYARCEHVYIPTPTMREVLLREGVTSARGEDGMRLWPRGVETHTFRPEARSYAWRRAHGIADDEVVFAFVSRLVWEKGLDVFADVAASLVRRGVRVRTLVVGDGPARDGLEERLIAGGVDDAVFGGYLTGDALATAYASSDVFCFPSDTETFGNVTLEAMASGLPSICADATGSNALLDDGVTGFLAPAGDVAAFLEPAERLARDASLRAEVGARAHEAAQAYEWSAILAHLSANYAEAVSAVGRGM